MPKKRNGRTPSINEGVNIASHSMVGVDAEMNSAFLQPRIVLKRINVHEYELSQKYEAARQKMIANHSEIDYLRNKVRMNESATSWTTPNCLSSRMDRANNDSDDVNKNSYLFSSSRGNSLRSIADMDISSEINKSGVSNGSSEECISPSLTYEISSLNSEELYRCMNCYVSLERMSMKSASADNDRYIDRSSKAAFINKSKGKQGRTEVYSTDSYDENNFCEVENITTLFSEPIIVDNEMIKRIKKHLLKTLHTYRFKHIKSRLIIGCHTARYDGFAKCLDAACRSEAMALSFFIGSAKSWTIKHISEMEIRCFQKKLHDSPLNPSTILPHGNYLINLASPDDETYKRSCEFFEAEVKNCQRLGLIYYNFHPGSTMGKIPVKTGILKVATAINNVISKTASIQIGIGHSLGSNFNELKEIIDKVKDKSRIGVCIDICHAYAAGYNLSSKEGFEHMMSDFEAIIGLPYLTAFHLNDSFGSCGSKIDRHVAVGLGNIGIKGFHAIVNSEIVKNIPMILETPNCTLSAQQQIQLLYTLWDCDETVLEQFYN